ncbi:MAG: beta-ketoacyl synthase N-terminal-like domain-containing protein [Bacteroidia bacterium]|nr:hypothetical protein [Bacteroidia bacterium]MDW8134682.1 beta-ketoacyl synthase N-terminal-like domain-containing protein [Bacteroidia bacterium]
MRDINLYLRALWSIPLAEAILRQDSHWEIREGHPVCTIPTASQDERAWGLIRALAEAHAEEIKQEAPQAVIIGTARGELGSLLRAYERWKQEKYISPHFSPDTTLGSLASRLARLLGIEGPAWVVSQACISGMLALYQAALLIKAGEAETVLFGAVEAPVFPFMIEAMAALRIYSRESHFPYVQPGNLARRNSFALGEAAVLGILSARADSPIWLKSLHVRTASCSKNTSFTAVDQIALKNFIAACESSPPDMVWLHAPGTRQGDEAEYEAIRAVWGEVPAVSVKIWVGHSLGAAPLVSLATAVQAMRSRSWLAPPYPTYWGNLRPTSWNDAAILALGYGGAMGIARICYAP